MAGTDAVPRYRVAPGWAIEFPRSHETLRSSASLTFGDDLGARESSRSSRTSNAGLSRGTASSAGAGSSTGAAGQRLIVHAGADHLFAIDDVAPEVAAEVRAFWEGAPGGREAVSDRAAEILDQLVMVGALLPAIGTPGAPLAVGLSFVGRPLDQLGPALAAAIEPPGDGPGVELVPVGTAALVVYVRTSGTLAEVAHTAAAGSGVSHLLVDVAYHHTVSLGPLVVPGDTACLTCLAGRVGSVWGDPVPPEEPLAARNIPLLAGLLANELTKVAAGDRGLANRTVALDLAALRLVEGTILKHPWCPACSRLDQGTDPAHPADLAGSVTCAAAPARSIYWGTA